MKKLFKDIFENNVDWCDNGEWAYFEGNEKWLPGDVMSSKKAKTLEKYSDADVRGDYFSTPENPFPATKIKIYTRLSQNPSKSNNGGDYYFFYCYYWVEEIGMWEKRYYCSSDFAYCDKHGMHQECRSCISMGENGCTDSYDYYTSEQVEKDLGSDYDLELDIVNNRKMIVKKRGC